MCTYFVNLKLTLFKQNSTVLLKNYQRKMIASLTRTVLLSRAACVGSCRFMAKMSPVETSKYTHSQIEYLQNALENKITDWKGLKANILTKEGNINEKNLDAVLLKSMVKQKKYDAALSFTDHLKKSQKELNVGAINGVLFLYAELSHERKLTAEEKKYILDTYSYLYAKYKVLDCVTCEMLLHALCAVDEWEKAHKVLDDIHLSGQPTHSAYSTLIATLFRINKPSEAMKLIDRSIENRRPLQHIAYEEWTKYILRKYKVKKTIVKHLEGICEHISKHCESVSLETAMLLRDTFADLGWTSEFTKIKRQNGQCVKCKGNLDCLNLSKEEFQLLQNTVKEKLIVGSDLFLKSSPDELKNFLSFVEKTAPYDIVIDALNVAYTVGMYKDKAGYLAKVVTHFTQQDMKVLLLGRKHMMKWPKMNYLLGTTCSFFTDNLSQDDPYFITAAILSGSHTDVVSKDLLRGHRFLLRDQNLSRLFQRWQWQHQWKVFLGNNYTPKIQEPLPVTPCAQKNGASWHLPFVREDLQTSGQVRDGTPDWGGWLCLRQPSSEKS